jgi:peptide/nickel transport system substrate-binding protein
MKKTIALLALLAVCSGCVRVQPPKDPRSIHVHLGAEPATLNPVISTDAYESTVNRYVLESLAERDPDTFALKPLLAESWTISPDRLVFTFRLRRDVRWSDGTPFTAEDILFSYRTIQNPDVASAPLKVYYIDVADVRKIDDYTVVFTYKKQYFRALEICASMPIPPRHIYDNGEDFNRHSKNRTTMGTGPYTFDRWDTGKQIGLKANPNYRGPKPALDRIVYRIVAEPSVALRMLKKGDLDVLSVRPIDWVRQTASPGFEQKFYKLSYFTPSYSYIGWNLDRPQFQDRRVRQAMTMMLNRQAILDKLLFGLGAIVSGNFFVNGPDYDRGILPYPHDPAAARKLLAEAGWKDTDGDGILDRNGQKFSFVFTISAGSKFAERLATIMKEDFSRAGIVVDIQRFEWAVFVQKLQERNFDAVTLAWSMPWGDADPYQVWHSTQINGGSNFVGFANAEADSIIERSRMEFDPARRQAMFHRFHRIVHDEQPYTFLYCNPSLAVVSKRFDNVKLHAMGLDFRDWRLKEEHGPLSD